MALNLVRNSKVFFTTNVDSTTGKVAATGFDNTNTFEIQVLEGFSFSQNTNNETVTIMEAGAAPVRGQRAFNTSLAPVDFSFSTYLRPKNTGSAINAEESVLWNAMFSTVSSTAAAVSIGAVTGATYAFSNGVGTLTLTGTAMTGIAGVSAGDVVVVSGITVSSGASDTFFNAAAIVTGTPSATAVTLTLVNPTTTASTLTAAATVKLYKSAWAPVKSNYSYASTAASDKHQLLKFGMLFVVDNVAYAVDNAAMAQVTIDFGIDAIATAQWTGQATALRQVSTNLTYSISGTTGTFGGTGITGSALAKVTDASYIANKLSTVDLKLVNSLKDSSGTVQGAAGVAYTVPITGGSITINNNITYLTPANLGVVNLPVTYYTGARSITGTLNAYLRTGTSNDTGELLADMLAAASATIEPMASLGVNIGGASTIKVNLDMPATVLSIPTVDVQQVVSTAINFTAEGYIPSATTDGNVYDLSKTNDFAVRYYA